ncbi:hypothetical protein NDU88_000732 [Pleurodeles waltl]|uniref:Uncharacterized protein n=1 Tax=Pleurodeles waltl TaxID=8319 RepID=A0AAV7LAR1_PLEWA|nr:hypothetical protein NDU88_000732 [Pleurodeles waltl]
MLLRKYTISYSLSGLIIISGDFNLLQDAILVCSRHNKTRNKPRCAKEFAQRSPLNNLPEEVLRGPGLFLE